MHVLFLGGANEVGASSALVTIEGQPILVDAGIRMCNRQDRQLPEFSALEHRPSAVLLTHAHTDHTGALPVLVRDLLESTKVYCTPATREIARVLLEDNANRMKRERREGGDPSYTRTDVDAVVERMSPVPWRDPVPVSDSVTATWIPAGHILGAAMICIEGEHERVLITGDVSGSDQLSILGMDEQAPHLAGKPDAMIMESTYGDCRHPDRTEEESRLLSDVAATIDGGGKVLIPVFAVGRAQEVILILKRAMQRKEIPEFPVFVDGMVRQINDIYSDYSRELSPALRWESDLFYSDSIMKVTSKAERDPIMQGEPCCIVASSGMLKGGVSSRYAEHLVRDSRNLVALSGYQAKGTPGYELEKLPGVGEAEERTWKPSCEQSVPVESKVERYRLSAHADKDGLTGLVRKIQPGTLLLGHGDREARQQLKRETSRSVDVRLPENGDSFYLPRYRSKRVA